MTDSRLVRPQLKFETDYMLFMNAWARGRRWTGDQDENVKKLSLRAIGLLVQLMSHSEGFTVTFRQLARDNAEGDHAIRTAVEELRAAGFLTIERERYRGKIIGSIWVLQDPAIARANQLPIDPDAPRPVQPRPGKPHVDKPHAGEQHAIEVSAEVDLPTSERTSSSTRARNEDELDALATVCPATGTGHRISAPDEWCQDCTQVRGDGKIIDRFGKTLREGRGAA